MTITLNNGKQVNLDESNSLLTLSVCEFKELVAKVREINKKGK